MSSFAVFLEVCVFVLFTLHLGHSSWSKYECTLLVDFLTFLQERK